MPPAKPSFYTQVLCPLCSSDPQDVPVFDAESTFEATCGNCGTPYSIKVDPERVKKYAMVG